jgi:uncharacterized protein YgiM (DUF1202 family)
MRSALRLIPLLVIGAVAAFLLVGPLTSLFKTPAVASRPQPTATVDAHPSPTSCPASLPMPKSATAIVSPSVAPFPHTVWVNTPLGVNLRSAASANSSLVSTLSQGTQATADSRATDAAGNPWYHVSLGGKSGWLRADFMTATPIHTTSGTGWSLMLPADYTLSNAIILTSDPTVAWVKKTGDDVPFLTVQTSAVNPMVVQLPTGVRPDINAVADHNATIQVWNYTVVKHVSRVAIDTCKVASAWARPDQGWPYLTEVYVHTAQRNYDFSFITSDPNSPLVSQVLDSIALS